MQPDVNVVIDYPEFFGKTRDEIMNLYAEGKDENYFKKWSFDKYNPSTREELHELYKSEEMLPVYARYPGNNWFSDLAVLTEHEKNINYIYKIVYDLFPDKKVKILDYGAGPGIYSFKLLFQGFSDVTLADIPHKYFQFLKFLCKKYNIALKFHALENDHFLTDKYEYIICSEMLEHTWEPVEVLQHLVDHLVPQGWMFISTFFDNIQGKDPTHLQKNMDRYNEPDVWLEVIKSCGMDAKIHDQNGVPKGFQRRY